MRLINKSLLATAIIALTAVMCLSAQDSRPRFVSATIKPNPLGIDGPSRMDIQGDLFVATDATLRRLLTRASLEKTVLQSWQIIGAPDWMDGPEHFDIQAKMPKPPPAGMEGLYETGRMVRSLLEDRFKLKAHFETIELPAYNLVVAPEGMKLKLSADQTAPDMTSKPFLVVGNSTPLQRGQLRLATSTTLPTRIIITSNAVPIKQMLNTLVSYGDKPIFDQTHLTGLFDFTLELQPKPRAVIPSDGRESVGLDSSVLATALPSQLGLKLESARGPVEVLVIDSVSKPSEN